MKFYQKKAVWAGVAAGFVLPVVSSAQLFGPAFTIDLTAEAHLFTIIGKWTRQAIQMDAAVNSAHNQEEMMRQNAMFFTNKSGWQTALMMAQNSLLSSTVTNTYGETGNMTQALTMGGRYALPAWANSALKVDNRIYNGTIPNNPMALSSLATIEMMQAAGTNNIGTVGSARQYLASTQQARTSLQNTIADGSAATNTPTQQMNLIASASGQQINLEAQNLQVNASTLQTMSVLAKEVSDVHTNDLNSQAAQAAYEASQPTGVGGMANTFMSHP